MFKILLTIFAAVFLVSLVSIVGLLCFSFKEKLLEKITFFWVSFAAGALLGAVFLHFFPEVASFGFTKEKFLLILAGILIFFFLEKIICWHHCQIKNYHQHQKKFHHLGIMSLLGDSLHNFLDGVVIASSFLVNYRLGWTAVFSVVIHEIPQEIGDFFLLLYSGFPKTKALFLNFLSALLALFGALLTFFLQNFFSQIANYLIFIVIGSFIYIALADFFPELRLERSFKKSLLQFFSLIAGIILMFFFKI